MCLDCDDSITSIPSGPPGPTGPTGPQGPAPTLSGTSTTSLTIGTGSKTFTTQSGIAWVQGQRLRAVDSTNNNLMEGEVTSYSGTTLILSVDYTEGSGTINSWTISIVGSRGSTGSTGSTGSAGASGKNAYGISTGAAISLGSNLYTLPITDNTWGVVGQIIYVETAGYYQITVVNPGGDFTILDLLYSTNTPSNMTSTSGLGVTPAGIRGATGSTGSIGAKGDTGPAGPTGPLPTFGYGRVLNTNIPSSTNITLLASSASTGSINFSVTGYLESSAAVTLTAEILVNGVATGIKQVVTGSPALGGLSNIGFNLTGQVTINTGNSVVAQITLDDYTKSSVVRLINLNYCFQ